MKETPAAITRTAIAGILVLAVALVLDLARYLDLIGLGVARIADFLYILVILTGLLTGARLISRAPDRQHSPSRIEQGVSLVLVALGVLGLILQLLAPD